MEIDRITTITFFLNGISSLLGWNVILAAFDYFGAAFPKYAVATYFPIPLFVAYVIIALLFNNLQKNISYKKLIVSGITITNVALVLMLIVSVLMKQTLAGFIIEMSLCGVVGIGSNLSQLSFFAILNYLSAGIVSTFNIGTSVSMLFIQVLRIIILAFMGSNSSNVIAILIYFAIALAINFVDLVLNIRFFLSKDYKQRIQPHQLHSQEDQDQEQAMIKLPQHESYFHHMWRAHKEVYPFDLILLLCYIQTFALFPAITLERHYSISFAWASSIIITCYAIGDTIGKFIGGYRFIFNGVSIIYTVFSRFFFFFTMVMLTRQNLQDKLINNDYFAYVNQIVFALTNGLITNGCFVLAFEKASHTSKRYAGILCGIMIQVGIMIGSILAVPMKLI